MIPIEDKYDEKIVNYFLKNVHAYTMCVHFSCAFICFIPIIVYEWYKYLLIEKAFNFNANY